LLSSLSPLSQTLNPQISIAGFWSLGRSSYSFVLLQLTSSSHLADFPLFSALGLHSPLPKITMSSISLPPELFIEIISFATGDLPSRDWLEYRSRRAILRSLSLVNSSFRSFAQPLLVNEIWHSHLDSNNFFEELTGRLVRLPSQGLSIRHASVSANLPLFDGIPTAIREFRVLGRWTDLVSLKIDGVACARVPLRIDDLGHFPRTPLPLRNLDSR